jgi:folate-binding protein YgfZ
MFQSTLLEFHKSHGGVFAEREGWLLPLHFGDARAEYEAVRTHVGLMELPQRAFISLTGPDRTSYLQGLFSNDVRLLTPGRGLYGTFLNQQGKVLSDARLWCLEDSFLLDLWRPLKENILAHLNRYLVADDVEVADLSGDYGLITLQGLQSEAMAARLIEPSSLPKATLDHSLVSLSELQMHVTRYSHTGTDGFDFIVPQDRMSPFATLITDIGKAYSARWVGEQTLETLRIEAGIPRYGIDFTDDTLLLETGMDHAVSFTKGCYLGQEVVERIRSRGHVNKKLVGLLLNGSQTPQRGAIVTLVDEKIGTITSATHSPIFGRPIALAYVHRDHWSPGTRVEVASAEGRVGATVAALPFAA